MAMGWDRQGCTEATSKFGKPWNSSMTKAGSAQSGFRTSPSKTCQRSWTIATSSRWRIRFPFYIRTRPKRTARFLSNTQIVVEAYSPLATGAILDSPEIKQMAEKYGVTSAQLSIRYCLKDTLPLPKSTHEARIIENAQLDFNISPEDVAVLDAMKDVRAK